MKKLMMLLLISITSIYALDPTEFKYMKPKIVQCIQQNHSLNDKAGVVFGRALLLGLEMNPSGDGDWDSFYNTIQAIHALRSGILIHCKGDVKRYVKSVPATEVMDMFSEVIEALMELR